MTSIDALSGLESAESVEVTSNPVLLQANAEATLAQVQVSGALEIAGNGSGEEPFCVIVPP